MGLRRWLQKLQVERKSEGSQRLEDKVALGLFLSRSVEARDRFTGPPGSTFFSSRLMDPPGSQKERDVTFQLPKLMNRLCTEVRTGWREISKGWDRNLRLARMGAVTTPDLQGRSMEDAVVGRRLHGGSCGLTEGRNPLPTAWQRRREGKGGRRGWKP